MDSYQLIGKNIRMHRLVRGIKLETLARGIKITKGRMSQIEQGVCRKLTLQRIQRIADCLNIGFFELFKTGEPKKEITDPDITGLQNFPPELVKAVLEELTKKLSA